MPALRPGDPTKLGDWTLTRRIAEGGAGNIFQGVRGVDDSENAAIKVLKDEAFDVVATQEYLKREVAALKLVDHANVAKLIEANFEPGEMWLATEYVYGPNLETFLKQNPDGINELRWFQIAENIFSGLVAVHSHNIIHRDIKPSNVMLSEQTREAKIIDFGISYVPSFTAFSPRDHFEGSRLFAAPENISLKDDPKMDVFSAAVTLAYLGRGSSIWKNETPSQLTESIIKGTPNLEGLSKSQQDFLKPLLAKLPSERYSSVEAHKKSLEYLQYLVGKRKEPRLNYFKLVVGRIKSHKKRLIMATGISLGLCSLIVSTFLFLNPSNQKNMDVTQKPLNASNFQNSGSKPQVTSKQESVQSAQDCLKSDSIKPELALANCLSSSKTGNGVSSYTAAYIYHYKFQDNINAAKFANLSIMQGNPEGFAILGEIEYQKKQYQVAIEYLLKGEKAGAHFTAMVLGSIYHDLKNNQLETKYFVEAAATGDPISMYNAGNAYYDAKNIPMAQKYYLMGANAGDASSMWALGSIFQLDLKDMTKACTWYKKASDAGLYSAQQDFKNYCSSSTKQASENNKVRASYPTDPKVVEQFLFGKPWLNNSLEWQIEAADPGNNLPEGLNGLQFKDQNRPETPWISIPYKIVATKVGTTFEVDAVVPQITLDLLTKQTNFCPKFRFVKEVDAKVVEIWSKSDTTCEFAYGSPSPTSGN
jgi:serine/threonine protein kinase